MTTNTIALAEAALKHSAVIRVTTAKNATHARGPGRGNADAPDTVASAHSCDQPPTCWLPQGQPAPASSPPSGDSSLFNAKDMETVRDGCGE